ncbi:hypothetical protein TTHERM_01093770 (macronuclear) [Tetrahymena thermophila SB210]|uniref:Uncharacterized protein n=1 Tax=Tetrahymena thermophila (strain SB210) TaxID=312017 RepID=Q22BL8_TETTS|nr:hypothetical protein TTHERM_01093770 [Tetrahymena thermophila SB210]EAR82711.2 hypothetical protein TTHERM_01093770 [Tetrahymena thermophila SB210]|eukprot:XP_001030374.2 hypothetical protein TTHERM_01093770 [Tetrahymena thermophila SB210]
MSNGYKDYSRDYSAIQNAGHNLVSNRGYSAYKYNRYPNPQDYNYGYNRNVKTNQLSNETSRYDELDILDQFSQPLLQKQGGDVMGNLSSIQMGQNKRNDIPQIRGSSANPRNILPNNRNPYPPQPPPPSFQQYPSYNYQQPPPYSQFNPKQEQSDQVAKLLQQQLDKQNEILSQLANNLDKSRNAQMNQQSQAPQPDYSQKLRDIEKEYEMMNEIQNLRREIGSIVNQKNQINPLIQQQQQQFQMMQMQQMMMNPYMNPMMMMLMNQMNQQNPNQNLQPPQQPFQNVPPPFYPFQNSPPPPQQNKYENENRLEELLKQLLKEKALNNMQQSQQIPQYQDNRFNYQNRGIPSRQPYPNQNDQQINFSEPSEYIQNQYQPIQNTQPSQKTRTQMSNQKPRKVDTSRFRKKICKVVLFLRWLKQEVIKSKKQFKQYEVEEFSNDYLKAQQDALPWLTNSSTKALQQIVINCKKEQDITDLVVKKLNAKEQESRFNAYTEECNTILDEMTKTIDNIPESVSLFIVKKFYDNSYFSNNPFYLFEFEIDRLEFDQNDQRLINIDNFPDSPRFKMLLLIYIFIKIYLPSLLIKPWEQNLDPSIRMIENYITTKKFSILCSIMYHQIMDYLKINVPLVQRKPNEVTWAPIPKTQIINNSKQVQLQPLDSTKEELLTLAINRDQLSTFYSKKQQWIEQFRQKLDLYAKTVRQKLQQQRIAYLEIRKELLQDKAKDLQKIIPQNLRNVQLKN